MKAESSRPGPAPGADWPPRIAGHIIPATSLADRWRLGHARVVFLHFLEQDPRLPAFFEKISKQFKLPGDRRRGRRGLIEKIRPLARRLFRAMKPIARDVLHLDRPWVQQELLVLYLRRIGLPAWVTSERGPFEEPAPPIKLVLKTFPHETAEDVRRRWRGMVEDLIPASPAVDKSRSPRHNMSYLAEYVFWFYLRTCHSISERRMAKIAKASRAGIRKGVATINRLFALIDDSPVRS